MSEREASPPGEPPAGRRRDGPVAREAPASDGPAAGRRDGSGVGESGSSGGAAAGRRDGPGAYESSASGGPAGGRHRVNEPETPGPPAPESQPSGGQVPPDGTPSGEEWLDEEAGPLVRLYGVTRGRTHAEAHHIDLLTVVIAAGPPPSDSRLGPEHLAILRMCRQPVAVVEIGSSLDLPVGVLRVLIADLHERGLVTLRLPNQAARRPSEPLLEELLNGLQQL